MKGVLGMMFKTYEPVKGKKSKNNSGALAMPSELTG
jgi:hypothetical protein